MNNEYEKEKKNLFNRANERANKIIKKYHEKDYKGQLDGEPWTKEMIKDSKRVLNELKELDEKYKDK